MEWEYLGIKAGLRLFLLALGSYYSPVVVIFGAVIDDIYGVIYGASLVAQRVKNPPAMQDTQVLSLGWEDPLEKEMETHSRIFAWEIPWTEEPGVLYSPLGCKHSDTTQQLNHNHYIVIYNKQELLPSLTIPQLFMHTKIRCFGSIFPGSDKSCYQ